MIDGDIRVCRPCAEKAGILPLKRLREMRDRKLDGWYFRSVLGVPCTVCGNIIGPCTLEHAKDNKEQQLITVRDAEVVDK